MSGAEIAAEIADAYVEAGIEAGDGNGALTVTISRAGAPTGPDYKPTPGTPVPHTFMAKPVSHKEAQRQGFTLANNERVYSLVNHDVEIAPSTEDELVIGGVEWAIVEVNEKNPAGYVLSWLVKVSA